MEILRAFIGKFQGWRLLFVACWALFVLCLIVLDLTSEPVYRDPDLFPTVSIGERVLVVILFLILGVVMSFAIPSEKLTAEEVSDKISLVLTIVGLFVLLRIGSEIYFQWDAIEGWWHEQTTDCEDLVVEIAADQQCLENYNCTMSREELMASNDRALRFARLCTAM